jgi:hypothetical protein
MIKKEEASYPEDKCMPKKDETSYPGDKKGKCFIFPQYLDIFSNKWYTAWCKEKQKWMILITNWEQK